MRLVSQRRYVGISTTGAVNVQPSEYDGGGDPTRTSSGPDPAHHGSGAGDRSSSVPAIIRTPVSGNPASCASSWKPTRDQAATLSNG